MVLYETADVETFYDNIWIAASALGLSYNANTVIGDAIATIDAVTGVIGAQPADRVFVSLGTSSSSWTSGSDTFMSDLVSKAGGSNVFDGHRSSWFMVSKEQVHAKQPTAIIVIYEKKTVVDDVQYAEILKNLDPLWKETPAFRNGEIYVFSGDAADMLQRPGPRLSEAIELLAKVLSPEPFLIKNPGDSVPKYFGDDYGDYLTYQRPSP